NSDWRSEPRSLNKAPTAAETSVQVVPGTGGLWYSATASASNPNGVQVTLLPDAVNALRAGKYIGYVVAGAPGAQSRALTVTLFVDTPSITRVADGAGFRTQPLASEQSVSVFGYNLGGSAELPQGLPLGTTLAGTTVSITDGAGVARPAQLAYAG